MSTIRNFPPNVLPKLFRITTNWTGPVRSNYALIGVRRIQSEVLWLVQLKPTHHFYVSHKVHEANFYQAADRSRNNYRDNNYRENNYWDNNFRDNNYRDVVGRDIVYRNNNQVCNNFNGFRGCLRQNCKYVQCCKACFSPTHGRAKCQLNGNNPPHPPPTNLRQEVDVKPATTVSTTVII